LKLGILNYNAHQEHSCANAREKGELVVKSKSIVRIMTIVSIVATVCVYAVMGVSAYTSVASLAQSVMGLQSSGMQMSGDPSTGVTLTLSATVWNPGLLEVSATLKLKLLSADKEVIAEGVGSKRIPLGSSENLIVSLYVPPEKAQTYLKDSHSVTFSISFEFRTLFDLVGMSISVEMGGEGPPPGP